MNSEPWGERDLIMDGPKGVNYKNKSIFREVEKHKKIVYEHVSAPKFITPITFERRGNKTLIEWHMLFDLLPFGATGFSMIEYRPVAIAVHLFKILNVH